MPASRPAPTNSMATASVGRRRSRPLLARARRADDRALREPLRRPRVSRVGPRPRGSPAARCADDHGGDVALRLVAGLGAGAPASPRPPRSSTMSNSCASDSTTTRTSSRSPARIRSRIDARVTSSRRARRSATVGTVRDVDLLLGEALDAAQQPVLARLGERDRGAVAAGAAGAADPVHVRLGGRRHVVVDDVREVLDVEAARGDVGGDEQVGLAAAEHLHDAIALPLLHAAVQRLRAVAVRVQRLDERLDLEARAAEHDAPTSGSPCRARDRAPPACARRGTM